MSALVAVPLLLGSAAASPLEWELREANHPVLGQIRFAFPKGHIVTSIGKVKVFSRPYVSCERGTGKIAIEVTHGISPDDTKGLQPKTVPRLVCGGPRPEELVARWTINDLGDVLARGLLPPDLRRCAAIHVEQDVSLPQAPGTARVEFVITPSDKVLDAVFVACGGATQKSTPTPISWRSVRTIPRGKTNVRAQPNTSSPVVVQLDPGAMVTVQPAEGDWWRARSSGKLTFDGYIRSDRLVLK